MTEPPRNWKFWAAILVQGVVGVVVIWLMAACLWQTLDVVLHARRGFRGLGFSYAYSGAFLIILLVAAFLLRLTVRVANGESDPKSSHLPLALVIGYFGVMFPDALRLVHGTMESGTRHNLEALRAELSNYHEAAKGGYPAHLDALTANGSNLTEIPQAMPAGYDGAYHGFSSTVKELTTDEYSAGKFSDSGGWAYVVSGSSAGTVVVNCTHGTGNGRVWTSY